MTIEPVAVVAAVATESVPVTVTVTAYALGMTAFWGMRVSAGQPAQGSLIPSVKKVQERLQNMTAGVRAREREAEHV